MGLDWRRDPLRIVRVLQHLDADVVALQEADKRLAPRQAALPAALIENETHLRVVPLAHSAVSLGWHGNAILVNDRLDVVETRRIELPGIEPRGCVMARLAGAGDELTVLGVHLGLRRGCRRLQFARILDELSPEVLPRTVIMGDFNEWSNHLGLDALSDVFDVIAPGRSFHAARPVACLDRFALGPGVKLLATGVESGQEARIASDDLPVWAEIALG